MIPPRWAFNALVVTTRLLSPFFVVLMLWYSVGSIADRNWWALAVQVFAIAVNLQSGFDSWFKTTLR